MASMEKRKPERRMLSSDSDLWNFSWSAFSSSSSLCFLFLRLFRRSLALFEESLEPPEELSSDRPPLQLYSPLSVAAAAATCRPITAQTLLSGTTEDRLSLGWQSGSRCKKKKKTYIQNSAGQTERRQTEKRSVKKKRFLKPVFDYTVRLKLPIHLEHDALELMSHGLIISDIMALTQATKML